MPKYYNPLTPNLNLGSKVVEWDGLGKVTCSTAACVQQLRSLFDFNKGIIELAMQDKAIPAYFVSGTLRGCCEDLIVLAYLQDVPNSRRDEILDVWLWHEIHTNVMTQTTFFRKNRPFQNILASSDKGELQKLTAQIQSLWNALGFAIGRDKIVPPTRSLAKKSGVAEVYDFWRISRICG